MSAEQSIVGLGPSVPDDELLRPALELAFAVAVAGTKLRPAVAAPPALRRFLKFQKLPASALSIVRDVVEADDVFRRRVASIATDELVDELGATWLARRPGWEQRVAELLDVDGGADEHAGDRGADRRRAAAEQAFARVAVELDKAREDLARERLRRSEAEQRAATATAELESTTRELRVARSAVASSEAALTAQLAATAVAETARTSVESELQVLSRRLDEEIAARVRAETLAAGAPERAPTPSDGAGRQLDDEALAHVSASLVSTADGLRALATALRADPSRPDLRRGPEGQNGAPGRRTDDATSFAEAFGGAARPAVRRSPLSVPGGLLGDSTEVALHLLRQPDVHLLVDGYNVAKLGWPDLSLEEQRTRLLDAMEDLVRRIGVRAVVVFDGADVAGTTGRRLVRVRFSAPGVQADDEIRALTSSLPAHEPVVVATNDQAIVRGVRSCGANVIGSEQLLATCRR